MNHKFLPNFQKIGNCEIIISIHCCYATIEIGFQRQIVDAAILKSGATADEDDATSWLKKKENKTKRKTMEKLMESGNGEYTG